MDMVQDERLSLCLQRYLSYYQAAKRIKEIEKDNASGAMRDFVISLNSRAEADLSEYKKLRARLEREYGTFNAGPQIDRMLRGCLEDMRRRQNEVHTANMQRDALGCATCIYAHQDASDPDAWCTKFDEMPPLFAPCGKYNELPNDFDPII